MLTDDERTELHRRLQEIEAEAQRVQALADTRLATALQRYRLPDQAPLRMR